MYAIVQVGGRQYRAAPGERLVVDRLDVEPGSRVHLSDVRMLIAEEGDGTETEIGRPRVEDVSVAARAVSHFRGPKILVFKYKPKKRYRRHQGFRAELTELRIEEVRRGAYEDKPAPAAAKKRTRASAARPTAAGAAGAAAEKTESLAVPVEGPAKAVAPARSRTRRSAKPAAAAVSAPVASAAAEAKPKTPRASRKPAAKTATAPAKKKAAPPRAKAVDKQEQPNGS
ncbi:MAG TPA: 50S ribosomal protein L21 [Candidatus Dormibacteraeota bacterium]|nr:50S ribosomal protein L21 [Candidatus Dormibacteraeota bacterium]